jgi:LysW-gamma-L-lysine/LysW-L-ornithine aminotransferase
MVKAQQFITTREYKFMDTFSFEDQNRSGLYSKRRLAITKGKGALLWDEDGTEYIDCSAGHGVANVGHAHPKIIEAISAQVTQLISCPESFYNNKRANYYAKLVEFLPNNLSKFFLCNSGTEAVEAALKLAKISTGRTQIVAAMRGFHGRTMGALAATWNKKYRGPFSPLVPNYTHVPYNNLEKLSNIISEETAAVLIEVVQGEGGVHIADKNYIEGVRKLCDQNGALLIIDEIQTGFGRTGKMFAIEHYDVIPDIICLAKSIAGGIPMGAIVFGENVKNISPGLHGSTFGGNPLACAAAAATLEILQEESLVQNTKALGDYLLDRLNNINSDLIREVRGLGLMVGIELKVKATSYLEKLLERGVIALPAGLTVIRLLPPLVISKEQIDIVVDILEEILING